MDMMVWFTVPFVYLDKKLCHLEKHVKAYLFDMGENVKVIAKIGAVIFSGIGQNGNHVSL